MTPATMWLLSGLLAGLVALAFLVAAIAIWVGASRRRDASVLFILGRCPASALEVQQHLGTSGAWVYSMLRRLERRGLLRSWEEPGGPDRGYRPKRIYALAGNRRQP